MRGQLFIVPETGHGTFQSRPELVNLAVSRFLDAPDSEMPVRQTGASINQ